MVLYKILKHSLKKINNNISDNSLTSKRVWFTKLILFVILCLIFSFIYLLIPDYEFGGINTLQTMVENEILTNKISSILNNKDNLNALTEEIEVTDITDKLKESNKRLYEKFNNNISIPLNDGTNDGSKLPKLINQKLKNNSILSKANPNIHNTINNQISKDLSDQLSDSVASLYGSSSKDFYNKVVNEKLKKKLKPEEYDLLLNIEAQKVANFVNKIKLSEKNLYPSIYRKWFDRFYFSVVTGITLGFGDIYPNSFKTKAFVIFQLIIVYSLIII